MRRELVVAWLASLIILGGCGRGSLVTPLPAPQVDACPPAAPPPGNLNREGRKELAAPPPVEEAQQPASRLLVKLHPGAERTAVHTLHARVAARVIRVLEPLRVQVVEVQGGQLAAAAEAYRSSALVERVEPDRWRRKLAQPNDPLYLYQWHFRQIRLPETWDCVRGSAGVVVAVVDDGITAHPDLQGVFTGGRDFVEGDDGPWWPGCARRLDGFSHGMYVSSLIASLTDNGLGVAGVNWGPWGARIMPLRALRPCLEDGGFVSDIAAALVYAADHGAHVINMSFGGSVPSETEQEAIRYAYAKGAVLVAAAGNSYPQPVLYPARYPEVIAVGAVNCRAESAYYAAEGPEVDVVAPGGSSLGECGMDGEEGGDRVLAASTNVTLPASYNHGYFRAQGTSASAAHTSGVAALLVARGLRGTEAVRQRLRQTAIDLGQPGRDDRFGWGLVDAAAAVR